MNTSATKRYLKDSNGKVWSHKSVLALLESASDRTDPESLIRKTARDLVAQAKSDGWSGPPYDPKILASFRGINVEPASENIGADARILPDGSGNLVIQYDPQKPLTRTNFSICHELAHTFFPDCYEVVRHRGKHCSHDRSYFELECLCDLGAAELLMPDYAFSLDMVKLGHTLAAVRELSTLYVASSEAVLIRMSQLSMLACAVVFLSEKLKPREKQGAQAMDLAGFDLPPVPPKLRVDYVRPSETFDVFIPQDKSVPDTSAAYECLETNDVVEAFEQWDIRGFGQWRVQAVALPIFGDDSPRRVAALVSTE